jgi:Flp pilus assembly protein protease CpaA
MLHRAFWDMCLTVGIAFAVILPFFHYRIYRGGDAKLLIACGAWLGSLEWLIGFALGMFFGAIYALGVLLTNRTERKASVQSLRLVFWSRLGTLGEDSSASRPTVPMAVTFGAAMLCVHFVNLLEFIEQ